MSESIGIVWVIPPVITVLRVIYFLIEVLEQSCALLSGRGWCGWKPGPLLGCSVPLQWLVCGTKKKKKILTKFLANSYLLFSKINYLQHCCIKLAIKHRSLGFSTLKMVNFSLY